MYRLELQHHFDAAHHLELDYASPCEKNHGHHWLVDIIIVNDKLNKNGILIDFKHLKKIIDKLDHENLNDILSFNPTAENISKYLYDKINELGKFKKVEVKISESLNASIAYSKEDDE